MKKKTMEEKLNNLNEILKIQGLSGNWNTSEYMRGLYNGLELASCILEEREPNYKYELESVSNDN